MDLRKQFATYEIALALKGIDFDEGCFGYYTPVKSWMISTNSKYNSEPHFIGPNWANQDMSFYFMYKANSFGDRTETVNNSKFKKSIYNIAVPLWQQVIDWFREKYNYHISVYRLNNKWCGDVYDILRQCYVTNNAFNSITYSSYEEARKQAILKAIELCQKEK